MVVSAAAVRLDILMPREIGANGVLGRATVAHRVFNLLGVNEMINEITVLNSVQKIAIRQQIAGEYTVTRVQSDGSAVVRHPNGDADGRFLVVDLDGGVCLWSDGQENADDFYPFPQVKKSEACEPSMAAWRLALRHGHRWAEDLYDGERVDFSPEAVEAALALSQADDMCTTVPSNYHTTATGRVVWAVTPVIDSATRERALAVKLEIHRSDTVVGGLGGGTIPVIRVRLMADKKSGTGLIRAMNSVEVSPLCEKRHYIAMWHLLDALGQWDHGPEDECKLWDLVSRGCLGISRFDHFTHEDLAKSGMIFQDTEPVICY